ncbi:MAG: signal peptide peptidase SppA [Rikenellaceae bacterium]
MKKLLATIVGITLSVVLFVAAIAIAVVVIITVATTQSIEPLKRGTVLEINMNEAIVDSPDLSPLASLQALVEGAAAEVSILDLFRSLELAAEDSNITALSLRLDGAERLSLAHASELRDLLLNFRNNSAKPIYAYAEDLSQVEYFVASVADSIYLHPLGSVEWQGVAVNGVYYGDLFEEVGVEAEVFRPASCRYKSAVEPYISSGMSNESREQSEKIANTFWGSIVEEVSKSRGISTEALRTTARDQIIVEAAAACDLRMIDRVGYRDNYNRALERLGIVREKSNSLRTTTLASYSSNVRAIIEEENSSLIGEPNKIAIIYADGVIVDGEIASASGDEVVSGVVSRQLRRAREDDDVRAVIVRVNSPGGSALAADVVWREMELLQREKPLIVTMGSYAASGGYYISAPADLILANRYTLTGSIGVYGVLFAYEEALRRHLHIAMDGVGSEPSADFGRLPRSVTPIERAAVMRGVESVYTKFKECVASGRRLSPSVVEALGGGRVWCGEESVGCGLTDGVGGIREAVTIAIDRCDMGSSVVDLVEYGSDDTLLSASLGGLWGGSSLVESFATELRSLLQTTNRVMALTPERVEF